MEILPYFVSNFESVPKSSTIPGDDGRDFFNNSGFDLKYGLTSNLTLDATINPDFGQVELDSPILNLSAFETFYGEKRPFFLEGADLFSTRFMLFYSRRIGRPPTHGFDDSTFSEFTDFPKATSILGAGKLTGKLSSGTSIGIITAVTAEEKAEYLTTNMDRKKGIVEPTANYSVFRIKQDVMGNSSIGGLITVASQDTENPATTGGIDWRLLTPSSNYGFEGQIIFSEVEGYKTGLGYTVEFSKNAGKHIRGSFGGTVKDPNLQINRLGYTSRNDDQRIFSWVQYRTSDDWWIIRNSWSNFNYYANWNYSGTNTGKGGNYNGHLEFTNNWSLGGGVQLDMTEYNDYETRGNGLWKIPEQPTFAWWASLNSDYRKSVSFNLNPGSGVDRDGTWWANYIGIDYRPSATVELSVGANYHRTFGARRWVYDESNPLVFARLDKDQLTPQLTASIMFHRNLSFQASARGIIAALDYREAEEYLGEDAYQDIDIPDEETKYDYNYTALNSTLLLRWEYRPGSTLYVVWTRSRGELDPLANNLDISRDFNRFFSNGAGNVFLVKASYWWNI